MKFSLQVTIYLKHLETTVWNLIILGNLLLNLPEMKVEPETWPKFNELLLDSVTWNLQPVPATQPVFVCSKIQCASYSFVEPETIASNECRTKLT